jgi:hypothetical protein
MPARPANPGRANFLQKILWGKHLMAALREAS